jgi:hypothetical protein
VPTRVSNGQERSANNSPFTAAAVVVPAAVTTKRAAHIGAETQSVARTTGAWCPIVRAGGRALGRVLGVVGPWHQSGGSHRVGRTGSGESKEGDEENKKIGREVRAHVGLW